MGKKFSIGAPKKYRRYARMIFRSGTKWQLRQGVERIRELLTENELEYVVKPVEERDTPKAD